jgi:hypothetical protein
MVVTDQSGELDDLFVDPNAALPPRSCSTPSTVQQINS